MRVDRPRARPGCRAYRPWCAASSATLPRRSRPCSPSRAARSSARSRPLKASARSMLRRLPLRATASACRRPAARTSLSLKSAASAAVAGHAGGHVAGQGLPRSRPPRGMLSREQDALDRVHARSRPGHRTGRCRRPAPRAPSRKSS